jgi:hypothetical protein
MRKINGVLRLKLDAQLSHERIRAYNFGNWLQPLVTSIVSMK